MEDQWKLGEADSKTGVILWLIEDRLGSHCDSFTVNWKVSGP